jgi:SH3-like domain-containing protein
LLDKLLPPNRIERTGETSGFWIKVTCCGKTGWIDNEDGVVLAEMPMVICRVKASGLNLRNNPSGSAGVVAILSRGERCQYLVTSDDGQWGQVKRSNGDKGWVAQRFISFDQHR